MTAPDHTPDAVQKTLAHTGASIHALPHLGHRQPNVMHECLGRGREHHTPSNGFEQGNAGELLQLPGSPVHGRLLGTDIACRLAVTSSASDGNERMKLCPRDLFVKVAPGPDVPGSSRAPRRQLPASSQMLDCASRAALQDLSGLGQKHALRLPVEKRGSVGGLQFRDGLGNGRLREMYPFGRQPDASCGGHLAERDQVSDVRQAAFQVDHPVFGKLEDL